MERVHVTGGSKGGWYVMGPRPGARRLGAEADGASLAKDSWSEVWGLESEEEIRRPFYMRLRRLGLSGSIVQSLMTSYQEKALPCHFLTNVLCPSKIPPKAAPPL